MANLAFHDESLDWGHLNRFLLIGNELGLYETPLPDLQRAPTPVLDRCLRADGVRVVRLAASLLLGGRPCRPEPAIQAIARAITHGGAPAREEALEVLPFALRTSAHLFRLVDQLGAPSAWPRALRVALGDWYTHRTAFELVSQVLRSPPDTPWDHRTVLGLAYPKAPSPGHAEVFRWLTERAIGAGATDDPGVELLSAHELLQTTNSEAVVTALLRRWPQLRTEVPPRWLGLPALWRQLLPTLATDALVAWLPRLAGAGVLHDDAPAAEAIARRLQLGGLSQAGSAPAAALRAVGAIRDACQRQDRRSPEALEMALLTLFHDRLRAGRRTVGTLAIALDPAASTACDGLSELPGLSPRFMLAALALMAAASAREVHLLGFGRQLTPLAIAPDERVETLIAKLDALPPGPTNGAAPLEWAQHHGVRADAFLVLSGTRPRHGARLPEAALAAYRRQLGRPATWLGVSAGPHRLCLEPPSDLHMLEVCGLDVHAPALIVELLSAAP